MNKLVAFLVTGSIAALATYGSTQFGLPLWLLFLAWVNYFLCGCTPQAGAKFLATFTAGLGLGWGILALGTALSPPLGAAAFPLAVFVVAGGVMMAEGLPPFDAIPAYFMGIVAFFALGAKAEPAVLGPALVAAALGLLAGWASVAGRGAVARALAGR